MADTPVTAPAPKPQPKQRTQQDVIDDLIFVLIRLTRRHPSDRKAIAALNRLQPDGPWQADLDAHEEIRVQGIGNKIADRTASAAEIADYTESQKRISARKASA